MKIRTHLSSFLRLSLVGAVLAVAPQAFAQLQVKINVEDPKFDDLPSPEVGGNTGQKNFKPKDWLEVEVKVKLDARNAPKDKHIDRLTVKWYVAVENKTGEKGAPKYLLMEKQITHVNVPIDEDFYISCYLPPSTLYRITGSSRAAKGSVTAVGGEISCDGAVRPARFSSKGDASGTPWWNSAAMQRTTKFPLLNKRETPFAMLWWDRYLEIEPERQ